jgi:hypothetical protein
VQCKDLAVEYVKSDSQVADIFTKGLSSTHFCDHCVNLKLVNMPELEGE